MRKGIVIVAGIALAILIGIIVASRWPDPGQRAERIELVRVGATEVTIAFVTRSASVGSVRYRPAGAETEPLLASESPPPAERHELVVSGLEPGTLYHYWVAGNAERFELRTQPRPTSPFSLLLVWGDVAARIEALARAEAPELVLSLTPVSGGKPSFAPVRSTLPVFDPGGPTATVISLPRRDRYALDWGGLRLVVLADPTADPGELFDTPAPHTFGVVVTRPSERAVLDPAAPSASRLHRAVTAHNAAAPSRPVGFVLLPGASVAETSADGVVYLSLPFAPADRAGAARLDVSPDSTVASLLDEQGREVTLRAPTLARRRTCKECRQLADRGAYEQAVKAYREFIATHAGHYQIDDAYYAIAEILDQRLLRFAEALEHYRRLVADYPASTLAPLAQQRIEFLAAHSDHAFVPLARFERVRLVELARQRHNPAGRAQALAEVASILTDFPDCTLAPELGYWLANQHRATDPDRAVSLYRALLAKHPAYAGAADARIEIGETYYLARRYPEALAAFREARAAVPERAATIDTQIGRCLRNQRRVTLRWAAWLVLFVTLGAGAFVRGRQLAADARQALGAFVLLGSLTLFGGWLIHEQFTDNLELLRLGLGISAASCLGFPFAAAIGRKLTGVAPDAPVGRKILLWVTSTLIGLLVLAAGAYLSIYHANEHYLRSFGL